MRGEIPLIGFHRDSPCPWEGGKTACCSRHAEGTRGNSPSSRGKAQELAMKRERSNWQNLSDADISRRRLSVFPPVPAVVQLNWRLVESRCRQCKVKNCSRWRAHFFTFVTEPFSANWREALLPIAADIRRLAILAASLRIARLVVLINRCAEFPMRACWF